MRAGFDSILFSRIFSKDAVPIAGSEIELNHNLFGDCAGSKNFSMNCSCVRLYTCLVFQMDKLKWMNLLVFDVIAMHQILNW